MAIITISRGSFSGGKLLAENLARQLNYRCFDREVLTQRTSIRSIGPDELFAALETPPGIAQSSLNHRKYLYLALIQSALIDELSKGDVVYHGLAGHLLLQGGLAVVRLRVIAPLECRIRMAQDRMRLSRPEAIAQIKKVDEQRSKWTHYLYGVDWEDPSLYDLVINLQYLTVEQATRVVVAMVKEGAFEASAEQKVSMHDFILASHVRAALARDALTSNLEVEVTSRDGNITIKGTLYEENEEVERVARAVPGVVAVQLEGGDLAMAR